MSMNKWDIFANKRQKGSTIAVVLIVLVLMLLLGVTASKMSLLSNQSTRYQRDYLLARESAKSAIVDAIIDIESGKRKDVFSIDGDMYFLDDCGSSSSGDSYGLCNPETDPTKKPIAYTIDLESTEKAVPFGEFTDQQFASVFTGLAPSSVPHYIIETVADKIRNGVDYSNEGEAIPESPIYRITAIGFGANPKVKVVLQAEYKK